MDFLCVFYVFSVFFAELSFKFKFIFFKYFLIELFLMYKINFFFYSPQYLARWRLKVPKIVPVVE